MTRDTVAISHWDCREYLGDGSGGDKERYLCEVQDDRARRGRISISLTPESGSTDDIVDIVVEISTVPREGYSAPHILVQCGNSVVADLYQMGPETMQDFTKEKEIA
ncbi:MAG: hypothetical protein ACYDEV_01300 [Acidiferrobacter sp.]